MPELPEVQTVVDDLIAAGLAGRTVTAARVFWPRSIAAPSSAAFRRRIAGRTLSAFQRRGKYIVAGLAGGGALLIHLRMSGRLHLVAAGEPRQKHEHVVLLLSGGQELRLHDTRKFGRVSLLDDPETVLGKLGPEPLDAAFTSGKLAGLLQGRRRMLKPLLLDQGFIAGLGNIYADEALFEARLHPCRTASSLTIREAGALHRAIGKVLRRGLKNMGTTLGTGKANFYSVARRRGRNSDALKVFRRTGLPCPRCGAAIARLVVGQRSTHICRACQKKPT